MTFRSIPALLIIFSMLAGCKKKESSRNPCDGVLNESPPTRIMVKFIDKATGQNLILSKNLKAGDFTVVDTETAKPFASWRVVSEMRTSPFNGVLELSVFHETAAQHQYQIKLENLGTVTLAYTVSKTPTNNPCKPYAYPISDIQITGHPFTPFVYEGKSYPNILVLEV